MSASSTPADRDPAGERTYQLLRQETERQMGRAPRQRRIAELWARRGRLDCVTAVGVPDPVTGEIVTAIFDMGPGRPFVVHRRTATDEQACEVLACTAYAVSDFAP